MDPHILYLETEALTETGIFWSLQGVDLSELDFCLQGQPVKREEIFGLPINPN